MNKATKKRTLQSTQDRIIDVIVLILMTAVLIFAMYPLVYVFSNSISATEAVLKREVWLLPKGFNLASYRWVFQDAEIGRAYINTAIYAIGGTAYSMLLTILGAYPLSRKHLQGRNGIMMIITFTMLFNAGMIPTFLLVKKLKMINTVWAMIIPCAVSQYNLIIMRTGFAGIPDELEEAAKIDGANDFYTLFHIMVPLAVPTIMTITLFYFIGRWNDFYNAMIYLNSSSKYPLQLVLRTKLVDETDASTYAMFLSGKDAITPFSYKCALILTSMLPMLIAYPFVQRFFVKGVTLGAVKG